MRLLESPRWVLVTAVVFGSAIVAAACSASPPDDVFSNETSTGGKKDAGSSIKLPGSGGSGGTKNCATGGATTEVPGPGCGTGGSTSSGGEGGSGDTAGAPSEDAGSGCVPSGATETSCGDGVDNDCDGTVDCGDSDCRHPGECGCQPKEMNCGDGADDDCDGKQDCADEDCKNTCIPGAVRFCDDPVYCNWGQQTCMPDGSWGTCVEVQAPPGCEGWFWDNSYDASCCVGNGYCCQNYPQNDSMGNCAGVNAC